MRDTPQSLLRGSSFTDYLINTDEYDPEYCASLLQKSLKKKSDAVNESIAGYQITPEQKFRLLMVRAHLNYIEKSIEQLDQKLDEIVKPHEDVVNLLCTIPGVDRTSAVTIISEIGTDMSQFSSSKRLCSWAGLTPGNNKSAGKKKSVRITRAGVYLKPALVQVAHAAVKSKKSPYYKTKYERISRRRGKKRAIIAIARMILSAVYNILNTGELWNPCDLYKIDMPVQLQDKQKQKAVKQALKLLVSEGIISESELAVS